MMMMLDNWIFQISKLIPIENQLIVAIEIVLLCICYYSILIVFFCEKFSMAVFDSIKILVFIFDSIVSQFISIIKHWIQRTWIRNYQVKVE